MGREFQKRTALIVVLTPTRAFAAENACYGASATYSEPTSQPSSRRSRRHEADSSECRCWLCPDNHRQKRQRRPRPHHHQPSLTQPNNKHRWAKPSWTPDAVRGVTTTVPFRPAKGDAGAKRTQGYARGQKGGRVSPDHGEMSEGQSERGRGSEANAGVCPGLQGGRVSPAHGGNVPRRVTTATTWQKDEGGA